MRVFYFLFLALMFFQSCSMSNETVMDMMVQEDMQMDEENMSSNEAFEGDFISVAHTTTGKASVNEAKTMLTLTNFKTDNGPVLEVYLATDVSADTYITLGVLKGIDGDYEYVLPANVDYSVYNHVIIWCVDFKVNFGYAVLK